MPIYIQACDQKQLLNSIYLLEKMIFSEVEFHIITGFLGLPCEKKIILLLKNLVRDRRFKPADNKKSK